MYHTKNKMSTGEKNSKIEDGHLDHTLRPGKWDDYVGQETIKKNVKITRL